MNPSKRNTLIFTLFGVALALLSPSLASASLKTEGDWSDANKLISVDARNVTRAVAVERVAEAAGWSIVSASSAPIDGGADVINVHIDKQPASMVLETVLGDGAFVATRRGTLIAIKSEPIAPPPAAVAVAVAPMQAPPIASSIASVSPPAASAELPRGEDRHVTGGKLHIGKDEVVHDVSVIGGAVEIEGTVTGNVSVIGGSVKILPGAHVLGRATAIGGSLRVEDGARVDGDLGAVGGSVHRAKHAIIGGSVRDLDVDSDNDDRSHDSSAKSSAHEGRIMRALHGFGDAATAAALLFVFGAMLLALGSKRVDIVRAEIATRPMRSIAIGFLGLVAVLLLLAVLCVTIIGIPVAAVAVLVLAFAVYVGVASVLTTVGEALLAHRTRNPYAHLALGIVVFVVLCAIPVVGSVVRVAVIFGGIGAIFTTRGAGMIPKRKNTATDEGPYRTPAEM